MRMSLPLSLVSLAIALSGCTWVHMAPEARSVRVISAGTVPSGCEKRGEVSVSVRDSVAFIDRKSTKVRDELETLARNEAPGVGANTLQPLGEPSGGSQRFAAWSCPIR